MTQQEIFSMQAENAVLKNKVHGICHIYNTLRPILKFLKFFSFVKKGAKGIIEGAIAVLDEVCEIEKP